MPLARTIRVVGEVDYDETRLSRITTRTAGWLEEVLVDATWSEVKEGEPLAEIYSPELYAAQQELLVAGESLARAAERRLRLLGIGEAEIEEIRREGVARERLVIRSPQAGVVVERRAVEGAAVSKGETLYAVADLDRVWVQSEVFEMDLSWVRPGQEVRLETQGVPGPLSGSITFVDPAIDRSTRTARVRIEVPNHAGPDGTRPLRIGQRVDAWIEARIGADGSLVTPGEEPSLDPLAVPRSAVLRTGERAIAYVLYALDAKGARDDRLDPESLPGTVWYEMVEVRVGPLARPAGGGEERFPLIGGPLAEGAVVVTRGNLLLDSQAQLSGKPSLLFEEGSRGGGGHAHGAGR
jgi:Cu(I)/Ag(I) efflux system membrane fusion protein